MTSPADASLDALQDLLSTTSLPPVHEWHPEVKRDIDMRIARNGDWFYNGGLIARKRMVKLFSNVLRVDDDGETYLVTPAEKLRISVEDAPFTAVLLHKEGTGKHQGLVLTTNAGDKVLAGEHHPIVVEYTRPGGEPSPYILVRDRLRALISRSVFIELAELAEPAEHIQPQNLEQAQDQAQVQEQGRKRTQEQGGAKATFGVFSDGVFMPLAEQ